MREVMETEYLPGETCPECGSERTYTTIVLTSGFGKMICEDCGHEWVGDATNEN